jgi:hypothetical protein
MSIVQAPLFLHREDLQILAHHIHYLDKALMDITLPHNEVDKAWKWSRQQDAEVVDETDKAVTTQERLHPSGS